MQIVVNDEPRDVPDGSTVAALLDALKLSGRFVAVEVNLHVVPHGSYAAHVLQPGDRLEIVTLVGGG